MANILTNLTYILDTDVVISKKSIWISKVILYPGGAGKTAIFRSWSEDTAHGTVTNGTVVTIATNNVITSVGNFTAALITAGDVIKITASSTGNNIGTFLVKSRDSDDAITCDGSLLTNEAGACTYSWSTYTPYTVFQLISAGTETATEELDFGEREFDNLIMDGFNGTSCYVFLV